MKTVLCVLLMLSVVPLVSCSTGANPNNSQPPAPRQPSNAKPGPAVSTSPVPTLRPPVSNITLVAPPTRLDPSLPLITDMQEQWALNQLGYYGLEIAIDESIMSPGDAIKRGKEWFAENDYANKGIDLNAMQASLVRFTADAKFPEFNRLSWFVVAPPIMGLQLQGSPTVATRDSLVPYLWADDYNLIMDDETGEVWGGSIKMRVGHVAPRFTINQYEAILKYVESYGWWAVWYRTNIYNGRSVPQSVIDEMRS